MIKRIFDVFFSVLGLLLLWPLFVFMAIWIKLDSPGPVFFRQERVGRYGHIFRIHKFRTMIFQQKNTELITVGSDPRITRSGLFLRRYKLDELAQLIDVLRGKMSLVGPRPEVEKYVAFYPSELRDLILSVRPGITHLASIMFRNESDILGDSTNPEQTYIDTILPIKLNLYADYVRHYSVFGDLRIIFSTLKSLVD